MAFPSSTSDASLPIGPLKTLYPLACVLAGPEAAPALLLRVYQQAAERPPAERPDDREEWLLALVRAARDEEASTDAETASVPETETPSTDPLRQEVAEQRANEVLPVALAACSPQERFVLALGVLHESEDTPPLADTLNTTPSDARAALWAHLQAVLSEPEFALVEEALSDAFLRDAVRDWVETRFSPVPRPLQTRIRETLRTAQPSPPADEVDDASPSEEEASSSLLDRLPSRPRPRTLLFTLLIGALVLAGGIGVSYLRESSSPSSSSGTSLVAFSAERADAVALDKTTRDRSEAQAYLKSTWDRQIRLPTVKGARLRGVGRVRTAGDVQIPVVLYADSADGARIATFAYNYALVGRIGDTVTLDTEIRDALARRNRLVSDEQTETQGLLWRDRDDIFVTVAPSLPADSLRARLRP